MSEHATGKVIRVVDADTIKVLHDRSLLTIRLANIDAPEKGQFYYAESVRFLERIAQNKEIRFSIVSVDGYRRIVSNVYVLGKRKSLSWHLVKAGAVTVYYQYLSGLEIEELKTLEATARTKRLGFWKQDPVVLPSDYRKQIKL